MTMKKKAGIAVGIALVVIAAAAAWYLAARPGIGTSQYIATQTNQRIATLEKEAQSGTASQPALFELAHSYLSIGDYDNAIAYYTKGISMSSSSAAAAALYLGEAYDKKGDMGNAEAQYKNAIAYAETDLQALPSARGVVVPAASKPAAAAQEDAEKSVIDDILAEASVNLANLYLGQGKTSEAVQVLDNGTLKVPSYAEFYKILADIYSKQGLKAPAAQFEALYEAHISSTTPPMASSMASSTTPQ